MTSYYDIKRDKVYAKFPKEEFYVSPDPVNTLYDYYEDNILDRIVGSYGQQWWSMTRATWTSICLNLFNMQP
jgi:hypothetical protein